MYFRLIKLENKDYRTIFNENTLFSRKRTLNIETHYVLRTFITYTKNLKIIKKPKIILIKKMLLGDSGEFLKTTS